MPNSRMLALRLFGCIVLCIACCGRVYAGAEEDAANLYSEALSQIAEARYGDALTKLRSLQRQLSMQSDDAPLADDALYLKAYIEVMDAYRFDDARATIEQLRSRFADTAYGDSAAYLDAIALEQSGHTGEARLALQVLRERHTAVSLPFGFRWPAGGVMSRYWYERADQRLAILKQYDEKATQLNSRQSAGNGSLVVDVTAEGQQYSLTLHPSPVVKQVQWTNQYLENRLPPSMAVYSGYVNGHANSWARVVIDGQALSGMLSIDGQRLRLQSDQVIGTIDYYKSGFQSSDKTVQGDALQAPIGPSASKQAMQQARSVQQQSSTRLVPISLVVDAAFDSYYGGQGVAQAINNINMADGIYREQGIALAVDQVQTFGDSPPVFTDQSGTLESLLLSFRDYRMAQKALYSDSALVYLFTGANTVDRTLGLAWIDTLCRSDGYDVGVTTPSNYANILTTHEIGHSLGALHDSETSCAADSGKIMWPRISDRTQDQFSSCSIDQVAIAKSKYCLGDAVDLHLSASIDEAKVKLNVQSRDASMVVAAKVHIETVGVNLSWPSACVELTPSSADCVVNDVVAGGVFELELTPELLADGISESGLITAQVMSDVYDPEQVNNAVSIDLETGLITQSQPFDDMNITPYTPVKPNASGASDSGSMTAATLLILLMTAWARLVRVLFRFAIKN